MQCTAIDGNDFFFLTLAAVMQCPGNELFARAAFASDENADAGACDALHAVKAILHLLAYVNDIIEPVLVRGLFLPVMRLLFRSFKQPCIVDGNGGKVGEGLQELEVFFREYLGRLPAIEIERSDNRLL